MPRRKGGLLEDDSDSSIGSDVEDVDLDPDAREERALFDDPYQRKRKKRNGKEDALYGEFGDEDEDQNSSRPKKSRDWAKAPQFVSGERVDIGDAIDADHQSSTEEVSASTTGFSASPSPAPAASDSLPTAFGGAHAQRAFIRNSSSSRRPATPLSAAENIHFSKLSGTFGARMLAKMGWEAGTGLGATGEGIVAPVENKLRPQKMGLAFKGFRERTEQAKAEARRRGEAVEDDDDGRARKGKKPGVVKSERSDAWKRPRKVKVKVEHKTYEQILAEAGQDTALPNIGQIIDATGATPREVSSLAEISLGSWTPSTDPMRIPEVRYNIRLLLDSCKSDVEGLAREAKAVQERKQWLANEEVRLSKKLEEEAELISRLQQVHLVTDELANKSREIASSYEMTLDSFTDLIHNMSGQFPKEFDMYHLDEIVVAAIAPSFRRLVSQWRPLEQPLEFVSIFKAWREAIRLTNFDRTPKTQLDVYGAQVTIIPVVDPEKPMTPFDSLLWNIWLPRVRSCINNDWAPQDPRPAVQLYEAWSSVLPEFIRDNMLDQLILPKVQKAVAEWNVRNATVTLQTVVFPWLPHVGLRLEDFIGDSRRKVKSLLRAWMVGDAIPTDIKAWRDLYDTSEWDAIILKHVVPKLGETLRNDFRINPRKQDMQPFERVLAWATFIRPSIFSQLLLSGFFPKWLEILHLWLIQPTVNFEEVAQWYQFWKGTFPENVQKMEGIANGFVRGLQLMNKAIELGPDASTQLPRPQSVSPPPPVTEKINVTKPRPSRTQEITFRSIVEDFASSHDLLFLPTGKAHETSRMPLFRVSRTMDGKGGILVYILDDAVWAPDSDGYRAISLEDMVIRANA